MFFAYKHSPHFRRRQRGKKSGRLVSSKHGNFPAESTPLSSVSSKCAVQNNKLVKRFAAIRCIVTLSF